MGSPSHIIKHESGHYRRPKIRERDLLFIIIKFLKNGKNIPFFV